MVCKEKVYDFKMLKKRLYLSLKRLIIVSKNLSKFTRFFEIKGEPLKNTHTQKNYDN